MTLGAVKPGRSPGRVETLGHLRTEARNLQFLVGAYVDDLDLISGKSPGKLLYFIDAHDLKAYIEPDKDELLSGFVLNAEWMHADNEEARLLQEMRGLSDAVLAELLFDEVRQVVLLPSYGEEIDATIAYHNRKRMRRDLRLLPKARAEAEQVREELRRRLAAISAADSSASARLRKHTLDYIREHAPTIITLLRDEPDSPQARIEELVERSNLTPASDVDWSQLGLDAPSCERLRALRVDTALVERWHRYLEGRPERRNHSYRANQIDAEAITLIQQINGLLAPEPRPRVAARFVTRAMTLISALRDKKALDKAELPVVGFMRHPRLVALRPPPRVELPKEPGPERRLVVALQTYAERVRIELEAARKPDSDAARDEIALKQAVGVMVTTWKDFETWRIATAPVTDGRRAQETDELRRFFDSPDVIRLIQKKLSDSVERFGKVLFAIGASSLRDHLPLLVDPVDRERVQVLPAIADGPGPVEFAGSMFRGRTMTFTSEGWTILTNHLTSAAERYLGGALLLACSKRWELASTYADSAVDISRLPNGRAEDVGNEAQLLRAQIRRLGGLKSRKEERRQIDPAVDRMARATNDPRIQLEMAAQILELHLSRTTRRVGPGITEGAGWLEQCLRQSKFGSLVRMKALTLRFIYDLREARGSKDLPELSGTLLSEAQAHHEELCRLLAERRQDAREVPPLVRAIEIVSYQWTQATVAVGTAIAGRLTSRNPHRPPLRVPTALRLEARSVLEALEPTSNEIAGLVRDLLSPIVVRIEQQRRRDLIYAPVWVPYAAPHIIALQPDLIRPLVERALSMLARIAGTSQEVGVGLENRVTLQDIRDGLQEAARHLREAAPVGDTERLRRALFHVEMERCYAKLLLVLVNKDEDKQALRQELAAEYRAIINMQPDAAIPHFRLHVVLCDFDDYLVRNDSGAPRAHVDEERAALHRALSLIETDPWVPDPDHWIRSTMLRRAVAKQFASANAIARRWRYRPKNPAEQAAVERDFIDAFHQIRTGFSTEVAAKDYLYRLEATRRANNILYYATRFIVEHERPDSFARLGTTRDELESLISFVCPSGLDALFDVELVHTIGYAHFALGDRSAAAQAGERIFNLIADAGESSNDLKTTMLLEDALGWIGQDGQMLQLLPITSSTVASADLASAVATI